MTNTTAATTTQEAHVTATLHCGNCTTDALVAVTASSTHHPDNCPTVVTETIPASELRPGDVVLDEDGFRRFAAFDVEWDADRSPYVRVWTALADQDLGQARELYLVPIAPVTVRRQVVCSACRYITGHTSWCPNRAA